MLAHITTVDGKRVDQTLSAHSRNTARYAAESVEHCGFYNLSYLAGLLHDMGKAKQEYQNYLERAYKGEDVHRGSVNHTFAGVIYILERFHGNSAPTIDLLTSEIIAYAIGSHHGLFDCISADAKNGYVHRLEKNRNEISYDESKSNFLKYVVDEKEINALFSKARKEVMDFLDIVMHDWPKKKVPQYFLVGLLMRLMLSCVIYGDRKDTSEFMEGHGFTSSQLAVWYQEQEILEQTLRNFKSDTELNRIRKLISEQCLEAADYSEGIYKVNVPTGGGKTLSTLRFALAHAEKYKKKKLIFVIPLLSVLEQNALVIRHNIKNENLVTEHHSNVIQEQANNRGDTDKFGAFAENWESPIIITTLVQLLNTLFIEQTSAAGRMRALCDSVIIIDEVQSLPKKTMAMFNMALNFLSIYCHATIILSSATQPCFDEIDPPIRFSEPAELVALKDDEKKAFERSKIVMKKMQYCEWNDFCFGLAKEHASLLVICNTKKEARNLYLDISQRAEDENWYVCHLSTAMCKRHRLEVLQELQEKLTEQIKSLNNGQKPPQKVICIATQMVEAGIDISFQCVVRVKAGIDNLAQSAGRCNRSNEYGEGCIVYFVDLMDECNESALPKEISQAQISTDAAIYKLEDKQSLISEKASELYYQSLYRENMRDYRYPSAGFLSKSDTFLYDLFGNQITFYDRNVKRNYITNQPFAWIGHQFNVFDEDTTDILVPYGEGENIINDLMNSYSLPFDKKKELLRQAKAYSISIYSHQKRRLLEKGLLYGISQFDDRILVLTQNAYDLRYGLNENADLII